MKTSDGIITVLIGLVGLATLSVLFSNKAQTASVTTALTGGFATLLKAAVAPVSNGLT